MRLLFLIVTAVLSVVASFASDAVASIQHRGAVIDLQALTLPGSDITVEAPLERFVLDVGDTLVFHLQFAGGQLQFDDTGLSSWEYIGLNFQDGGQSGFLYNGTFHFEGVAGELLENDVTRLFGGPIGGSLSNLNLTDSAFSFSGLTYTVNVVSKEPGRPSFESDQFEFRAIAGYGQPGGTLSIAGAEVPEPASIVAWSLLAVAGLTLAWRQRQAR